MITAKLIKHDDGQEEIEVTGEVHVGDVYPNVCCPGFDWVVSEIIIDAWGNCTNPDCKELQPQYQHWYEDPYFGVSHRDVETLADRIIDAKQPVEAGDLDR